MYKVPMEKPKFCNKCPFCHCTYSHPFWSGGNISHIDGKKNGAGTQGYVCSLDHNENGKYTKIMRGKFEEDIKVPEWCPLIEVKE